MEWIKLLSQERLGEEKSVQPPFPDEGRSEFQRDFDRIVFSSAFRRLQDKTQVFPLPESDFVHNRLTHSLEVSCLGRSLGNIVGERILQRHPELKNRFTKFHFGEIVAAACLAHDIGNPPFGHSGEDAIAEYFRQGNGRIFEQMLDNQAQWCDFIKFEGNAQGFRLISKLQNPKINGGLRLTYATLASFVKYPKESHVPAAADSLQPAAYHKLYSKYGFFQSEKDLFRKVADETGLIRKNIGSSSLFWSRHPLCFLVEAADDICYRLMDLEDGFHLGLLSFRDTEELLSALVGKSELKNYEARDENDKIGYLRAKAFNELIGQISEVFVSEEDRILEGNLENDLINLIPAAETLRVIKKISVEQIYSHSSVIEREAAGYEVLGGLLDIFITAVNAYSEHNTGAKHRKILQLLPAQFINEGGTQENDLYNRLLQITDFVSGMTDSYAVSLFRKIKGISLSSI